LAIVVFKVLGIDKMEKLLLENLEKAIGDPKIVNMLAVAARLDSSIPNNTLMGLGLKPSKEHIAKKWQEWITRILRERDDIDVILDMDIDLVDRFGPWLLSIYIRGREDYESLFDREIKLNVPQDLLETGLTSYISIKACLMLWHLLASSGSIPINFRDISKFDEIGDVADVVQRHLPLLKPIIQKKKLNTLKKTARHITLINDENFFVFIPLNYGSCYIANNSQPIKDLDQTPANWCTGSSSGMLHMNSYASRGIIIIVLCKSADFLSNETAKQLFADLKSQEPGFNPKIVLKWQIQGSTNQINCAAQYSIASDEQVFNRLFPGLMLRIITSITDDAEKINQTINDFTDLESNQASGWYPNDVRAEAALLRDKFLFGSEGQPLGESTSYNPDGQHWIYEKIADNTITKSDFAKLLSEATPEAIRDRIRRRMKIDPLKSHIDDEGHQSLTQPKMAARVQPSKKKSDGVQMDGQGKVAHNQSARTQKRKSRQ